MLRAILLNALICALGVASVAAGLLAVSHFRNAAIDRSPAAEQWSENAPFSLDCSRKTIVMFVNPQCPCTKASLEELHRVLTNCEGKVTAHVLFYAPASYPANWTMTGNWQFARSISGLQVHSDVDGQVACELGVETSGCVLLYNPKGELIFDGGITGAQGQIGDNKGETTLVSIINGARAEPVVGVVYGCSLFERHDNLVATVVH